MRSFDHLQKNERARQIHTIFFHRSEFLEKTNPVYEADCCRTRENAEWATAQFEAARNKGHLRPDIELEEATFAHYSLCLGLYSNSLKEPWKNDWNTGQISKVAIDAFFTGLRSKVRHGQTSDL